MLRRMVPLLLLLAASSAMARGFAEVPPKGVDLNGTWALNTALSDDPRKILEAERAKLWGRRGPPPEMARDAPDGRRTADESRVHRRMRANEDGEIDMRALLALSHTGDRFIISAPTPSGEVYKSTYRAGARSVVSVTTGVADREVGWKGKTFVISTRAVEGVNREDRYSLDKDGRLLVVTETRGRDIPKREIKRVYDRATS